MSVTFIISIVVIITCGIYFIVVGASIMISDRVTKNMEKLLKKWIQILFITGKRDYTHSLNTTSQTHSKTLNWN